jgi:hypothetical protein
LGKGVRKETATEVIGEGGVPHPEQEEGKVELRHGRKRGKETALIRVTWGGGGFRKIRSWMRTK